MLFGRKAQCTNPPLFGLKFRSTQAKRRYQDLKATHLWDPQKYQAHVAGCEKKFAEGYSADTMMYWGKAPPAPEPESKVLEVPKAPSMTPTAEPTSRDAAGDKTSLPCTCRNGLFGLLLKDWLMIFGVLIMAIAAFLFHRVRKVPTT